LNSQYLPLRAYLPLELGGTGGTVVVSEIDGQGVATASSFSAKGVIFWFSLLFMKMLSKMS
jgi:hypothetical protein